MENPGLKRWYADLGMEIGPSVTVNPIDHLKAAAYFHFAPTATVFSTDGDMSWAYLNSFSFGMTFSYKIISLGFETRWGTAKVNSASSMIDGLIDDYSDNYDGGGDGGYEESDSADDEDNIKMEFSSFSLMIGIRF